MAERGWLTVECLYYVLEEGIAGEVGVVGNIGFLLAVSSVIETVVNALLFEVEGAESWKGDLVALGNLTCYDDAEVFEDGADSGFGDTVFGDVFHELWVWVTWTFVAGH